MTLHVELHAIVTCDSPGCLAELVAPGGVGAAFELARARGWTSSYDRLRSGHRHRCPQHRATR